MGDAMTLTQLWEIADKITTIGILVVTVIAYAKGWVVTGSAYKSQGEQLERLARDNDALQKTLAFVTQGLAHPIKQTLDALPTQEGASSS